MNPSGNTSVLVAPTYSLRLPVGERIALRAIAPHDAERLQAYVRDLSRETRHNRFLGSVSELAPAQIERMICMNRPHQLALLAFARPDLDQRVIAEAMLVMEPGSERAEIALSVADVWQSKGVGTALLHDLERRARAVGARCLVGDVLRTNNAMKNLARKAGFTIRSPFTDARLVEIVKDLSIPTAEIIVRPSVHGAPAHVYGATRRTGELARLSR